MDSANFQTDDEESSWRVVPSKYGESLTRDQVRSLALVLDSRAIPCCIKSDGRVWRLLAAEQHMESAARELRLYEEANCNWPPEAPTTRHMIENTLPTISVLLLLATFYNLTHIGVSLPDRGILDWYELGAAHASGIMGGQWWQCVTALTLHADPVHLLSNLTTGGVIIILLCRELGSGMAWSLLLLSGSIGNLINAWVQSPAHLSIGSSTAVFGAVGIFAAISIVRYRRNLPRRWFKTAAAGLALLALLGSEGKNSDLGAHLFGFITGIFLGLGAEYLAGKYGRPEGMMNVLLAVLSCAIVIAAWWAAIAWGG